MKTQHTPGPWKIEENSSYNQIGDRLIIRAEDTKHNLWDQICEVGIIHTGLMGGAPKANARLIAAAPELLEALENLCESQGNGIEAEIKAYDKARAIIRKAKGE